ncbi:ESX secretion-associated protein EspG [Amycolatopsis cynarae]|uniref:ESX secretion-associated protein EspG n=1 Tax=Amycolatopsis cynarae TaxID=2995223 RepID=A0ABY7BAQ9_9PSEU|nr:ESX secretion-associated protein EspG [Amycolatopsis sp. HUAS 11-8]WAL68763.1 ESX secretion-associated protein EspG [Amycolatopsis sp. HUAS 11-8]
MHAFPGQFDHTVAQRADLTELDILCEDLGLGRPIHPYEIPYTSGSDAERAAQRDNVLARLRRDGWLSRSGSLRADLEDLLHVWANPEVVLTQVANVVEGGGQFLYRGGWRGRTGVLTNQEGTLLSFEELRPTQVIDEMVRFLPHWEPLYGPPVTYVEGGNSARHRPAPDPDGEFFGGIDAPPHAPSNGPRAAERFFAAPVVRAGLITCSIHEPGTRTRPGREAEVGSLTWFDTTEGRFMTGPAPKTSMNRGQVVNDLGNLFKELTGTIGQAVSREQSGWQGHGAEAAFQGLGGLSNWLDSSGDDVKGRIVRPSPTRHVYQVPRPNRRDPTL